MTGAGHDDPARPPEFDPVPEGLVKGARDAFTQRASGPTANLTSDSLVDSDDPAGDHRLMFQGAATSIELRVGSEESVSKLSGSVTERRNGAVLVHLEGSELALSTVLASGAFSFPPVPHGVVRLSFEFDDGSTLWTDWFQV